MDLALLDTDILSEVIKLRNAAVQQKALAYVQIHGQIAFSAMTRYEILRGYRDTNATTQLARFGVFCQNSLILPVSDATFDLTADLWVAARRGGHPSNDADLIIAATAIEHGRVLATGNAAHFAWIANLRIEDWRQP
ncbi:MAG: type II toxin-antitoxin system VapC family toxin [Pirellulaceae bacterium]